MSLSHIGKVCLSQKQPNITYELSIKIGGNGVTPLLRTYPSAQKNTPAH